MPENTISRRTVKPPEPGSPGQAGLAVSYLSGARAGERFRIEQTWPNGDVDPIYVPEDMALELAREIIAHYEFEVSDAE